jgi:hypothetical protein
MVSKKYEEKNSTVVFSPSGGDDFSEIETLLRAQVALNPKYKAETALIFAISKQAHLLLTQLVKHTGSTGFYEKIYVPFYQGTYNSGNFEGYSYYMMVSSDNKKVVSLVKKNDAKIKKFQKWATDNFETTFSKYKFWSSIVKIVVCLKWYICSFLHFIISYLSSCLIGMILYSSSSNICLFKHLYFNTTFYILISLFPNQIKYLYLELPFLVI